MDNKDETLDDLLVEFDSINSVLQEEADINNTDSTQTEIKATVDDKGEGLKETADINNQDNIENKPESNANDKDKIVAYLIIDKEVPGLLDYFRESGIKLSRIFTSIIDAQPTLLMQQSICRLIVVDTGMGKFTTTKIRQELIDTLSICDEDNKVMVFYTDSVLKIDAMKTIGKNKKDIEWIKYTNTASMVAHVLCKHESYSYDNKFDNTKPESVSDLLNFKGAKSNLQDGERVIVNKVTIKEQVTKAES